MQNNEMLHKFIDTLFPDGFALDVMEYGIIIFKSNIGIGTAKIGDNATRIGIDIEPQQIVDTIIAKGGNEVLLVHSQPDLDINTYPTEDDINLFALVKQKLDEMNIKVYNNAVISGSICTSFNDVKQQV